MAIIDVAVVPRASADRVGPYLDGVLRVRVLRPPADGEANRAVLRLVAATVGVAASRVELVAGATRRRKRLRIQGMEAAELERRLHDLRRD